MAQPDKPKMDIAERKADPALETWSAKSGRFQRNVFTLQLELWEHLGGGHPGGRPVGVGSDP